MMGCRQKVSYYVLSRDGERMIAKRADGSIGWLPRNHGYYPFLFRTVKYARKAAQKFDGLVRYWDNEWHMPKDKYYDAGL